MKDKLVRLPPLLFAAALFFAQAALASESAGTVRLDKNGAMRDFEILDQGQLGYCYAYSAAQVIDAYLASHGSDSTQRVSPIMLAFHEMRGSLLIAGGDIGQTIASARQHPVCRRERVARILNGWPEDQFVDQLNWAISRNNELLSDPDSKSNFSSRLKSIMGWKNNPDPLLGKTIEDVASTYQFDFGNAAFSMFSAACGGDSVELQNLPAGKLVKMYDPNIKPLPLEFRAKYVSETISRLLNLPNPQPVAISFCSKIVMGNPSYIYGLSSGECRSHESIVIGQRPTQGGGKEFLLRNSWGKLWCPPQSPLLKCEGGQVWIPAEILSKNVQSIFSLVDFP